MNIVVQVSFELLFSLGRGIYISRSVIAQSYGSTIFNLFRKPQAVSTVMYKGFLFSTLLASLLFVIFLMMAVLIGMR